MRLESYCGDIVRRSDPDRFMISMLLPANMREDVWGVLAFNCEIAKTRDVVSDPTLGRIRLQWWRDEICQLYSDVPNKKSDKRGAHEILKNLERVIHKHQIRHEDFSRLLDARALDLDEQARPDNIEGLLNYADFTTVPLYRMIVQVCGDDPELEIIQPIAMNYALAGILRSSFAWSMSDRVCLFPVDLMKKHNVTRSNIFSQEKRESLKALVADIVEKGQLTPVGSKQTFLRGCEILSQLYFRQIAKTGYDITSPVLQREPALKALKVLLGTKFFTK